MQWKDEILLAMRRLGGAARYDELYLLIEKTTFRELTKEWKATVRRTIEDHSSDSLNHRAADIFEHLDRGFWGIRGEKISEEFLAEREKATAQDVVEMVLVREHWRRKPSKEIFQNQSFTISHADSGTFKGAGLRPFFEYRDLGIKGATKGAYGAHVIRAVPGMESPGTWHSHDLDFQMVYVTKGWVVFEYEGQGEQIMRAGSCVLQPPGIIHREVRHSDDMELIEIIAPADFGTAEETAP
ncbi:cupin domain-containing protein [Sulfitobacter sp. G21635-S1]|uniref:cupin domain-containing protein n=1 Tax=Sulfitobacter sp. G21635-S1 TaxID=3014043 RepID=UPI0022AFFCB9|nr:cupin domain-containing protein [Sulfitobacter sp. G21635-S1]MCZ4256749.1 cupin domain-containing protein [Sulfitobacter sp. G21635-S1]